VPRVVFAIAHATASKIVPRTIRLSIAISIGNARSSLRAPGCYVFLRFALPYRASITFRMIARRSSGVVPAHLAA
jgi:hypothetical protein